MSHLPPSFPPSSGRREGPSDADEPDAPFDGAGDDEHEVVQRDVEAAPVVRPHSRVSTGLEERLAERRRARRRLRIRAVIAFAVGIVLVAAAAYVLLVSEWVALRADDVEVEGTNEIVTSEQVMEIVAAYDGTPLLRLDTGGLRSQLLEVVGVLDATVHRDLPHGLVVTIEPRVPVATVEDDDRYVLLDAEGVELARTKGPAEGVPVIEVPVGTEATADAVDAVLTVMAALPPELLEQVAHASATTAHEVEFELDSGATVVWGSAEENALKAEVLMTLLQVEASVYDVSAPRSPVTS